MSSQSLEELELKAKNRVFKGYRSIPINKLLAILDASKPIKENFEDTKPSFKSKNKTIREIRKENHDENIILRDLEFTFDLEKDHYEPQKTVDVFNNNYIQYESIGDNDKTLAIREYIDMIRPYLSDIMNDHKTHG